MLWISMDRVQIALDLGALWYVVSVEADVLGGKAWRSDGKNTC